MVDASLAETSGTCQPRAGLAGSGLPATRSGYVLGRRQLQPRIRVRETAEGGRGAGIFAPFCIASVSSAAVGGTPTHDTRDCSKSRGGARQTGGRSKERGGLVGTAGKARQKWRALHILEGRARRTCGC